MFEDAKIETVAEPGGAEQSSASLLRLASADAVATLDHLQASGLVAQGRVNVISLQAIADQLGRRWDVRRDLVHDHVKRSLERQFGGQSLFQQVSDTDYVICQPEASALAGQARCLNCLREILHHFLGAAQIADLRIHAVTRISPEGLYGEPLDIAAVEQAELTEVEAIPATAIDRWSPFVSSSGQRIRVSCALEPVILLRTSSKIGYRLARKVLDMPSDRPLTAAEQRNLSRADIQRIDCATIARGLDRVRAEGRQAQCSSLVVPVSYTTLSSREGRAVIVELFRRAQAAVRHGVICEIRDIEGVPTGALTAATAAIRPFCIYVVGRLNETPVGRLEGLRGVRLQALIADCPPGLAGDADFTGWARGVLAASRPVSRSVMLCQLASARQLAIAAMLGATHASFRGA
ncbi:MAG: hypothetical protein Q7T61_07500 [Caulobacter sp.]|nr:hypothetical protein [Caulobacter sp.]